MTAVSARMYYGLQTDMEAAKEHRIKAEGRSSFQAHIPRWRAECVYDLSVWLVTLTCGSPTIENYAGRPFPPPLQVLDDRTRVRLLELRVIQGSILPGTT